MDVESAEKRPDNEAMEKSVARKMGKKLGSGGRFKALVASGASPALAAYIGRKKYGNAKMAKLAAKGR